MGFQMATRMKSRVNVPSKRCLHIAMAIALVSPLAACSTFKKNPPSPVVAPTIASASSNAAQFQHALELLQAGDSQQADAELHTYLKNVPESSAASYLIAQIESPLPSLFPTASFSVRLTKNDTLSSLARTYLGNSLAFYGLARYNGIAVPSKVGEGQSIRIPKTAEANQARARILAIAAAPPPSVIVPTPPEAAPNSPATQHKLAGEYYQRGLVAFQHQDLDAAIADWDKALAIEPKFANAQLNRAQALRLKNNLAKLRQ
jgi:tetratricopeptide (TPR) repeat protein